MNNLDNDIFNHLASPGNFESAFEICNLFPRVKERLVDEFWQLVSKEIKHRITSGEAEFKDTWSNNRGEFPYIGIQFSEHLKVIFERMASNAALGIWSDEKTLAPEKRQKLLNLFQDNQVLEGYPTQNKVWLGYVWNGPDFSYLSNWCRILPDKREEYARELATKLIELANRVVPHLPQINQILEEKPQS